MWESGLTPVPVILDCSQQHFTARLTNAYSSELKELHEDPLSGTPICPVIETEHQSSWATEGMSWSAPGEEPVVKTIILDDKSTVKSAAHSWARENEANDGEGVWMLWTERSLWNNGRVGAAAICTQRNTWRIRHRYVCTGRMEDFNVEMCPTGLVLAETVRSSKRLQAHRIKTVAVFADSKAAIERTEDHEVGLGLPLARRIAWRARALLTHGITTEIVLILGHSGIHGNKGADRQANRARAGCRSTSIERPYTSGSNTARRIAEGRSVDKAMWETDKCSTHFSYRLKGMTGTKRHVPMTSVKSLPTRLYRSKSGHVLAGVYLTQFGHREDDECRWSEETGAQMREHVLLHRSGWRDQQIVLWKAVGKVTDWKPGRRQHVQV